MSRSQLCLPIVAGLILVSWLLVEEVESCFITNCPRGKRSFDLATSVAYGRKECSRCGPGLIGRCYADNICCSPLIGCNIGGPMAARCSLEALNPVLCRNPGQACGTHEKGVCALNATCCTSDGCFSDKTCLAEENTSF